VPAIGDAIAGDLVFLAIPYLVASDVISALGGLAAKTALVAFAEKTGFRVIDTGALSQAVTLEAIAWLHMQLQFSRGTNFASALVVVD
jgi:predicted dinucleotide-binding enzyme